MEYETPRQLANRLNLSREEFAQRLLTTLILNAPYPRWDSRNPPSEAGIRFLRGVWELSSFGEWPSGDILFVDEFELKPKTTSERGGATDYGVLWADHVWMIELKTESRSHRTHQIPGYFDLARHNYPDMQLELTYLTPSIVYQYEASSPSTHYAHLTWADVRPLIASVWKEGSTPTQQEVVDGLLDLIDRMETERASAYLESLRTVELQGKISDPLLDAYAVAQATAEDGKPRAVEYDGANLEDLLELKAQIREELASSQIGSPLRHVEPWLWRIESKGAPLTASGSATGYELRFSRNQLPLY